MLSGIFIGKGALIFAACYAYKNIGGGFVQKKLFVLTAIALAFPGLVLANEESGVAIHGNVNVEYSAVKIKQTASGGGSVANDRYQKAITDPALFSGWNITAKEDLGGGLAAIARIEYRFVTGAGVADVAAEQYVGLTSKDWGTVRIGSVGSVFRDFAGGASVDRFVGTGLELRGAGGAQYAPNSGFGTINVVDHSATYFSPIFNGFSVGVLIAPNDATQADPTLANTNQRNPNHGGKGNGIDYQVAVKYHIQKYGDVFAGYSQDNANDNERAQAPINGKTADDEKVWRIGANLKFADFGVYGQYDHISNAKNTFSTPTATGGSGNGAAGCAGSSAQASGGDTGVSTQQCNNSLNVNGDGNIWSLGLSYSLGKTLLVLQGGKTTADAVGVANERTAKNITIGAIYSLSKRTRFHAGYQHVSVSGAHTVAQIGQAAVGFTGAASAVLAQQPDRSVFSMGMRHTF